MTARKLSSADLRVLRAAVYGECSDDNWQAVIDNWSKPEAVQWLREHQQPKHEELVVRLDKPQ